jgi:HAMP domain-containing protein
MGAGLATVIFGVIAQRTLKAKLRPLAELEVAAHRLARADYSQRIEMRSGDAFESLAYAFNTMADQLESSLTTIQAAADVDRLILSGAGLNAVVQIVLSAAGGIHGAGCRLILRPSLATAQLNTWTIETGKLRDNPVNISEMTDRRLANVNGYREVANRLCSTTVEGCFEVFTEGRLSGVLAVESDRPLEAQVARHLRELTDRLSVAVTNIAGSQRRDEWADFDGRGLEDRTA